MGGPPSHFCLIFLLSLLLSELVNLRLKSPLKKYGPKFEISYFLLLSELVNLRHILKILMCLLSSYFFLGGPPIRIFWLLFFYIVLAYF